VKKELRAEKNAEQLLGSKKRGGKRQTIVKKVPGVGKWEKGDPVLLGPTAAREWVCLKEIAGTVGIRGKLLSERKK